MIGVGIVHEGKKIGESAIWETITQRRELQAEIDARTPAPAVPAQTPLYFEQDGTPVTRRPRQRRA